MRAAAMDGNWQFQLQDQRVSRLNGSAPAIDIGFGQPAGRATDDDRGVVALGGENRAGAGGLGIINVMSEGSTLSSSDAKSCRPNTSSPRRVRIDGIRTAGQLTGLISSLPARRHRETFPGNRLAPARQACGGCNEIHVNTAEHDGERGLRLQSLKNKPCMRRVAVTASCPACALRNSASGTRSSSRSMRCTVFTLAAHSLAGSTRSGKVSK